MKYTCPNGHESAYRLCLTCREAEIVSKIRPVKTKRTGPETRGRKKGSFIRPWPDETGKRYGRLRVIRRVSLVGEHETVRWLCECDCGGEKITSGRNLRFGQCKSCGCLQREWRKQRGARKPLVMTDVERKAHAKRVADKLIAKALANMAAQSSLEIIQAMARRHA